MKNLAFYLLLDKIKIQSANAISSPITYGFPAITAFLGAVHALSRKLPPEWEIQLDGVLVSSHDCQVQHYRPHPYADYTFNQSRNPRKRDGSDPSIIEEGKVHLIVSLMIEVKTTRQGRRWLNDNKSECLQFIKQKIMQQRIAGGSVQSLEKVWLFEHTTEDEALKRALLPGFVLVNAQQELEDITAELQQQTPEATQLDALIAVATLHHIPETDDKGNTSWTTRSVKTGRGWLVPIPVGFQAIADPFPAGQLTNCRTDEYPSQYVEAIYSLGKWLFAYRINDISQFFWRYHNAENLFLVSQ